MGVGSSQLEEGAGGAPLEAAQQGGPRKSSKAARKGGGLLSSLLGGFGAVESALAPPSSKAAEAEPHELVEDSRVWAFTYEDSVGGPEEDRKYFVCLTSAAVRLESVTPPGTVLLLNVGPLLLQPGLYSLFHNNVCELGAHWDAPRGAAVAPLDLLFAACASMQNWLAIDDDHLAVLHTRGAQDAGAGSFLRFVAACYLTFSEEFDFTVEALQELPRAPERGGPSWAVHQRGTASEGAYGTATAAQRRYCQYFDMLHNKTMPARRMGAMHLRQVILSSAPSVDGQDGCRPYVRVFWRGQEVKTTAPDRQVPAKHTAASGWQVPFELGVEVQGDVAISVHHYTGDIRRDDEVPLLVYAFHTAFSEAGLVRIPRAQLDSAYGRPLHVPPDFFLDVIMEPSTSAVHELAGVGRWSDGGEPEAADWKHVLVAYSSQDSSSRASTQEKGRRQQAVMRNVMSEMKAGFASGGTSVLLRKTPERSPGGDATPGEPTPSENSKAEGGPDAPAGIPRFVPPPPPRPASSAPPPPPPPPPPGAPQGGVPPPPSPPPPPQTSAQIRPPPPPPPSGPGRPPPPPPPPKGAPPPPPGTMRAPTASPQKASLTRALYWAKLPRVSGTIWEDLAAEGVLETAEEKARGGVLEYLFRNKAKRGAAAQAAEAAGRGARRESVVKLISVTRANNVAIMLTQFKMPAGEVRDCILLGGDHPGKGYFLSLEKLGLLLQVMPTEDEVALLRGYTGTYAELSAPEQFLATMAQVPRLRTKIQVLIFTRHFTSLIADTTAAVRVVQRACAQVRESRLLRRVLATILTVGNTLNAGTMRGNAGAVSLTSLHKLADMKVTPPSKEDVKPPAGVEGHVAHVGSLLEYVAAVVGESELAAELGAVGEAARWSNAALVEALGNIDRGMQMVREEQRACIGPEESERSQEEMKSMKGDEKDGSRQAERKGDSELSEGEANGLEKETPQAGGGVNGEVDPPSEESFGRRLGEFLAGAEEEREQLVAEADTCKQAFAGLADYLGESPANAEPEELFGGLWSFALQFDKAGRALQAPGTK